MPQERVLFPGHNGVQLSGRLETPDGDIRACAMFAHCFTCSKDVFAATRISRGLAQRGYAVLRFDFAGLGQSDGEFEDTNFSSNVADLLAAAAFMRDRAEAPALLIGHSLGGAAVLRAAPEIPECRAVCTVGAPSEPDHVRALLSEGEAALREHGEATIDLGGRPMTVRQQLIDDLNSQSGADAAAKLKRALLVFHSPIDATVGIDNAEAIYKAARHPKSFVSLDGADHLLTNRADAEFVADVLAAWAQRYVG